MILGEPNKELMYNIPFEIVELIADYHNYEKYCKPKHKKLFKNVLNDLNSIFNILTGDHISPHIVYTCWGNGWDVYYYAQTNIYESDIESLESFG